MLAKDDLASSVSNSYSRNDTLLIHGEHFVVCIWWFVQYKINSLLTFLLFLRLWALQITCVRSFLQTFHMGSSQTYGHLVCCKLLHLDFIIVSSEHLHSCIQWISHMLRAIMTWLRSRRHLTTAYLSGRLLHVWDGDISACIQSFCTVSKPVDKFCDVKYFSL